jgi:hypothetical protein
MIVKVMEPAFPDVDFDPKKDSFTVYDRVRMVSFVARDGRRELYMERDLGGSYAVPSQFPIHGTVAVFNDDGRPIDSATPSPWVEPDAQPDCAVG